MRVVADTPVRRRLERAPRTLPTLVRAALPAVPVLNRVPGIRRSGSTLPDLVVTRSDVAAERDRVAAYAQVCGFALREELPITYPHVLAFPLHMAILTDRSFPFPAVGTVHLENTITRHRPVSPRERLDLTARPAGLRGHARGRVFDIVVEVHSAGELVWESTSTLLRLGDGDRAATGDGRTREDIPAGGVRWRLDGDLGRRYAAVSGDRNPIHLYGVTARPFGFPRPIAHGMWSKARCLAALDGRLPDAVRAEATFKKPVLLPATVAFGSSRHGDHYAFALRDPASDAPHLLGSVTPA